MRFAAATQSTETVDCMHSRRKVMLNCRPDTTNYARGESRAAWGGTAERAYLVHDRHQDGCEAVAYNGRDWGGT